MSKKGIILIGVLLLVGAGVFWGINWYNKKKSDPYATFIKPRLELATFQIKSMTKEKTVMDMITVVDNPAPFSFTIKDLSYKFYIEDEEVMKTTYPKTIKLEKGDSSTVALPVTSYNEKMIKTLKKLEDKKVDSVNYRIKGQFFTDLPFMKDKPIDFDITKKGPLFIIPKIKILNTKVEKFGLKDTRLIVKAELTNENVFPFKFKDVFYSMKMDGDKLMEGKIDTAVIIPAKGKTELHLPMKLDLKETGETIIGLITKPKEQDYSFYMESKMISENNSLKDSKIITEAEGKLKDLIKQNK